MGIDATLSSEATRVGVLGLGSMGSQFVERIVGAGWNVLGFDLDAERLQWLESISATAATSAEQVVDGCDVVVTSLPSSKVTVEVLEQTVLPRARSGQIAIDLGTTVLGETRRLATAFADKGAALIDAPVSGPPRGGSYVFVGGSDAAVRRAWPLLLALGNPEHVTHGGDSGSGQILKGVNQLAMGLVSAAWIETISFATRQGISAEVAAKAVGGNGWRAGLNDVAHKVTQRDPEAMDHKCAELPYFLEAADDAGFPLPLTRGLHRFCAQLEQRWRDNMNRPYGSFWHGLHHLRDEG